MKACCSFLFELVNLTHSHPHPTVFVIIDQHGTIHLMVPLVASIRQLIVEFGFKIKVVN